MPQFVQPLKVIIPLGGAIVLAGIAGYFYYRLYREQDEEPDKQEQNNIPPKVQLTSLEVKIPKKSVGLVVGRHGVNIRHIEAKTSTTISFKDNGKTEEICIIEGKLEKVEKAKDLILKAIKDIPTITSSEIFVPKKAVGRILGRNGDIIHSIGRATGAHISLSHNDFIDDSLEGDLSEPSRKIVIKGTVEQIKAAKLKFLEKVEEEKKMREQIKDSASHISKRSKTLNQQPNGNVPMKEDPVQIKMTSSFPTMGSSRTYTEAFVSAVASSTHFWVQIVGPKTVELDKLVSEMTEYYDDPENKELHIPDDIKPGDVVAAKFPVDDKWYRGLVCDPFEDKISADKYSIYFVDFGDTDEVDADNVCELRTDFLRLSYQAIECFLANIDSASANSQEAYDAFETLTHACCWKIMMVRVLGYKQEGADVIPCVKIVDTSGDEDIDVAEELVRRGLANWSEEKFTSLSSSQASLCEWQSV